MLQFSVWFTVYMVPVWDLESAHALLDGKESTVRKVSLSIIVTSRDYTSSPMPSISQLSVILLVKTVEPVCGLASVHAPWGTMDICVMLVITSHYTCTDLQYLVDKLVLYCSPPCTIISISDHYL